MRSAGILLLLIFSLTGCTIGRDYVGNQLRVEPGEALKPGVTTLGQVMELYGSPDRIQRRQRGEVLVYRFLRGNTSSLHLEEPVITGVTFFVYTKRQVKANRLTLFFDAEGVLESYGYSQGLEELEAL